MGNNLKYTSCSLFMTAITDTDSVTRWRPHKVVSFRSDYGIKLIIDAKCFISKEIVMWASK